MWFQTASNWASIISSSPGCKKCRKPSLKPTHHIVVKRGSLLGDKNTFMCMCLWHIKLNKVRKVTDIHMVPDETWLVLHLLDWWSYRLFCYTEPYLNGLTELETRHLLSSTCRQISHQHHVWPYKNLICLFGHKTQTASSRASCFIIMAVISSQSSIFFRASIMEETVRVLVGSCRQFQPCHHLQLGSCCHIKSALHIHFCHSTPDTPHQVTMYPFSLTVASLPFLFYGNSSLFIPPL